MCPNAGTPGAPAIPPMWPRSRAPDAVRNPRHEHHRPKWQMALEMIDELIEWGRTPPVVTADAGYGDTTAFRQGLSDREIGYVVAVKGATSASGLTRYPRPPPTPGGTPPDPALPRSAPILQGPGRWPPDAPR